MDRWNIIAKLNYLEEEQEIEIVSKKLIPILKKKLIKSMVQMANFIVRDLNKKMYLLS